MLDSLQLALTNLLAPAVLFFLLGFGAGWLRSDLTVPESAAKTLALVLMLSIGFKGGVEASKAGLSQDFASAATAGVALSFGIPVLGFFVLRAISALDRATAAATAAHYGSVSIVTFVAGTEFLRASGLQFGGYMVAVVALMETPAILSALLLAGSGAAGRQGLRGELIREVALNGSVVVLIGSFLIGAISGSAGMAKLEVFVGPVFQGVLVLFLLDMGLVAARRLKAARSLTPALIAFALVMPLVSCGLGLAISLALGLGAADAAVLAILAASASYIAVPAAMRIALPDADPGVYLTLSLAITFPFNLVVGIPLYTAAAQAMIG
ncbi:sodium-dependent bicarbonate transport family permease [Phenylobacterium sp. J426]|uniref:sodium-dependent bicarbonate transport family permease n=1 Tax=Phenylobacterium sp. J426 TaxID=2898439 RepID=UPI002150A945|nr:sodium-dependent bicarbonate transport family permease [Phenylobacterium sp. J426]MCR5876127.1 sodium-dependent bicarbonate transport family permease [Phenylobacterium sp. J426]